MTVASGAFTASAEAFTADDFCGEGKFCVQTFWASEMIGTDIIQESSWGTFTKIDDTHIRLDRFKNEAGDNITFTIDGDRLILDGMDDKKGRIIKSGSKEEAFRLLSVKHGLYSPLIWEAKDRHYFIPSASSLSGEISRLDNPDAVRVTFTFDGTHHLEFLKRGYGVLIPHNTNADEVWTDYLDTFSSFEFVIFKSNGSGNLSTDGVASPTYTYEWYDADGTLRNTCVNLLGTGANFGYYADRSRSEVNEGFGLMMSGDTDANSVMPRQMVNSTLTAEYKDNIMGAGVSSGYMTLRLKDLKITNRTIGGSFNSSGAYEVAGGWMRSCGGKAYYGYNNRFHGSCEIIDEGSGQTMTYSDCAMNRLDDFSPMLGLGGVKFYVGEDMQNVAFDFNILQDENCAIFDSYDVYGIVGRHEDATEEGFVDNGLGHNDAIVIKEGIPASDAEETFRVFIPATDLLNKGWKTDVNDPSHTVTLYIRGNVKPDIQPAAENAPFHEQAQSTAASLFAALSPQDSFVTVGIDDIHSDGVRISSGEGTICVSGSDGFVYVYDASGKSIYGGGEGRIAVVPGLYIVKTTGQTSKVVVR